MCFFKYWKLFFPLSEEKKIKGKGKKKERGEKKEILIKTVTVNQSEKLEAPRTE